LEGHVFVAYAIEEEEEIFVYAYFI